MLPSRPSRARWLGALGFAVVGCAALAWLVHRTGPALLWHTLARAPRWMGALLALEGARIALEAWGARKLYARPIPFPALLRVGVVGYAVAALAPAGRATAEGVKAAMLARRSRGADTTAAAAAVQTSSLCAIAVLSSLCAVVAFKTSPPLAWTFLLQTALTSAGAVVVHGVARTGYAGRLVARVSPRAAAALESVRDHAKRQRLAEPLLALFGSRALQVVEYALMRIAVRGETSIADALMTFGVAMVGGTLGDSVPAQLGVSDASFEAAARGLHLATADALALALLAHAVQIAWIAVGLVIPLVWHEGRERIRGMAAQSTR